MPHILLEVCVDTPAGFNAAVEGGADRIELCSSLSVGGLTPSPGFMAFAAKAARPSRAMIRPRVGSYVFSEEEIDVMRRDIDAGIGIELQLDRRIGMADAIDQRRQP